MPENMTHVGVAGGKRDTEYEGPSRVIYDEYTLEDYDPDDDGTGNDFDPLTTYGFGRIDFVDVEVADGQEYYARYDYDESAIRLYNLDGTGEVGGDTTVDVALRVEVRGKG